MGCNFSDKPSRELIPPWLIMFLFLKDPSTLCSSSDRQGLCASKGLEGNLLLAKESSVSASLSLELSLHNDFKARPLGESNWPQMSKLIEDCCSAEIEDGVLLFGGLICRERSGTGLIPGEGSARSPPLNISECSTTKFFPELRSFSQHYQVDRSNSDIYFFPPLWWASLIEKDR